MLDRIGAELLELLIPSRCPSCDAPRSEGQSRLCAPCTARLWPLRELRGVHTAIAYAGTGEQLIRRYKFDSRLDALAVLLEPLQRRLQALPPGPLVPVPRHPSRVRQQAADPVHRLARALARRSGRELCDRVLWRARPAPPQSGLGAAERTRNVLGSFAARAGALRGREVLLLDDVTTTGATLREAARTLREQAGARRVHRAALAGTPPDGPAHGAAL